MNTTHHPSCLARSVAEAECICAEALRLVQQGSNASRRRMPRKTLVGVGVLALTLIGGVAFALYLLTAKINGTAQTNSLSTTWTSGVAPSGVGSSGTTCTASISGGIVPGNALSIGVAGYPGDTCTVTAQMKVDGSESAKITGVNLTNLPTGWTAEVDPATCGKTIGSAPASVTFKITVGPSGSTSSLGGGLSLGPVSQVPGTPSCAVQTGA